MKMTLQELEELSFRNMVEYHREDLMNLVNGASLRGIFTQNQSRQLKRHGILYRVPNEKHVKPTPKAMEIQNGPSSESLTTSPDGSAKIE